MFWKLISIIGIIVFAFMQFGCGSSGGGGTVNPPPTAPPRVVAELGSDPGMTTVNNATWDGITGSTFNIGSDGTYNSGVGFTNSIIANMKALYTNNYLYIRVNWTDNDADTTFMPWHAYLYNDIVQWEAVDTLQVANEDRFFILFDQGGTEGVNCTQLCHISSDTSSLGLRFYAANSANGADVWEWKANRTGYAKLAEDMHVSDTNVTDDPVAVAPGDNLYFRNELLPNRPRYMHDTDTAYHGATLLESDAPGGTFTDLDNNLTWVEIIPNPPDVDSVGKYIPGFYIRDVSGKDGSRWDVQAISEYNGTSWTLVMRRLLDPVDAGDVSFVFAQTDSIAVSVAVGDNSGVKHYGVAPFYIVFQK